MTMAGLLARWPDRLRWLRAFGARTAPPPALPEPLPDVALTRPFSWEASYPEGLDWRFEFEPKPLFSVLDEAAERYAARPCLDFLGRRSTYREVAQLVNRTAKAFQALGVGPGVRVG